MHYTYILYVWYGLYVLHVLHAFYIPTIWNLCVICIICLIRIICIRRITSIYHVYHKFFEFYMHYMHDMSISTFNKIRYAMQSASQHVCLLDCWRAPEFASFGQLRGVKTAPHYLSLLVATFPRRRPTILGMGHWGCPNAGIGIFLHHKNHPVKIEYPGVN